MRVLHLLSYHLFTGPAEPVLALIGEQRRRGIDTRLAVDSLRPGDLVQRVREAGVPLQDGLSLSVKAGPILLLRDLLAFKRLWAEEKFDLLHAHRSHDHTLALLGRPKNSRTRLVRTLHTSRALATGRAWQLRHSDGLVTVCAADRRRLLDRGVGPPERLVAVEGAVDCARFRPGSDGPELCQELGIEPGAPVAGIVARMKPGRGYDSLLAAWERVHARLPEARLVLAGRGESSDQLRRDGEARALGASLAWAGYRRDLPRLYRALDLKVLLAPGNDGTCRAALEAMASGVPVLAAAREALAEIVTPGRTGQLVPPNDPGALAQALIELLSDRQRLAEMGRAARVEAETRFTIGRQADAIDGLYESVLKG